MAGSRFKLYTNDSSNDRSLTEDLIQENNECVGPECFYLPKDTVNLDKLFGEAMEEKFESAYAMNLILENPDGFGGGQQLFNKFGMGFDFTDSLSIGMRHFQSITELNEPNIGDIIYIPMMDQFFSISYVNPRTVFYQNGQLYVFRMDVVTLKYDGENINTGNVDVDDYAPTTDSPFIEDDNDIIDAAEEKEDLIQDWDELDDINLFEEDD